jgi:hypothetical protein
MPKDVSPISIRSFRLAALKLKFPPWPHVPPGGGFRRSDVAYEEFSMLLDQAGFRGRRSIPCPGILLFSWQLLFLSCAFSRPPFPPART